MNINIENSYLQRLSEDQVQVSLYLINGIKLLGYIAGFDDAVILLKDNKNISEQLIYKHAISTIIQSK